MVDEFAPVCEVQSDKASVVITSRYKGKVSQILHHPGDIVKVGETLLELMLPEGSPAEGTPEGGSNPKPSISDPEPQQPKTDDEDDHAAAAAASASVVLATPAVRTLAKEYGLNLHDIPASGPNDRITKADVLNYVTLRENTQDDIQVRYTFTHSQTKKSNSKSSSFLPFHGPILLNVNHISGTSRAKHS